MTWLRAQITSGGLCGEAIQVRTEAQAAVGKAESAKPKRDLPPEDPQQDRADRSGEARGDRRRTRSGGSQRDHPQEHRSAQEVPPDASPSQDHGDPGNQANSTDLTVAPVTQGRPAA